MDFCEICKQKDYEDISLDIKGIIEKWKWTTLVLPEKTGKSTLLSMLYYYFDCNESSHDMFKNTVLASKWKLKLRIVSVTIYHFYHILTK